jgi:hypothetical protein
MKEHLGCEEARRLAERLIEGETDPGAGAALGRHLAVCPACRSEYALDLALIRNLKGSHEPALESVASEVMSRVREQARRLWLLRWGLVVSVISVFGALVGSFGLRAFEYILGLITRGWASRPETAAMGKVVSVMRSVAGSLTAGFYAGVFDSGLGPYLPQILTLAVGFALLVMFMMYGMGLWLQRPRGVRLWQRN